MNTPTPVANALPTTTADDIFEAILDAHQGLTPAQSQALNARLILTLAAQIGNPEQVRKCIEAAKSGGL